ncbi:MAG: hypothetical protein QF491_22705, partial [Alphaproteobacteria bacterium]|nr:hypothetical protein [Alphaproteobacteria bacterium]
PASVVDRGTKLRMVKDDFCGRRRGPPAPDLGPIEYGRAPCDVASMPAYLAALKTAGPIARKP